MMLDTMAIILDSRQFQITDYERFSPSAQGLYEKPYYRLGARANFNCYQNPTKTDMNNGFYKPRLTLTKRMTRQSGFTVTLKIEFSAPKLIFGNNFDELTDNDFNEITDKLIDILSKMGVYTDYERMCEAQISAVHYSKNVPLTDYSRSSMIINELSKINLNKKLDLGKTDYRNEGMAIRYHANSYEVIFYDKMKDMQQAKISEKRAIEKDYYTQADLFSAGKYPKHLDVIRMEVRLGNRQKIKSLLSKLDINVNLTFGNLFSSEISQKILNYFWQEISENMLFAVPNGKPEDIYQAIEQATGKKAKPAKILQNMAALNLIDSVGIRGLRALLDKHSSNRTWQRLKKELQNLKLPQNQKFMAVKKLETDLKKFVPVKLADYRI